MKKRSIFLLLLLSLGVFFLLTDCGSDLAAAGFLLSSSAFKAGGSIPTAYGCSGDRNYHKPSIPLTWADAPKGTQSFFLLMDDPAPVAKYWIHWAVDALPADLTALPEGASGSGALKGGVEQKNSWGEAAYGGPCPPDGTHSYRFQLFALSQEKAGIDTSGKRGDVLTEELMKLKPLGVAKIEANFP